MNDPPNSRNFRPARSGQPIVCTTWSSGFATFQTSFTRIEEKPAELAELPPRPQRPAHRVQDLVERLRALPDLLLAERPHLRVLAAQPEAVERRAGQMTLRPLGENRHARSDVRAG